MKSKKLRIGILTSSYSLNADDTGGAGVFVRDIAWELLELGHEVRVVTPRKSGRIDLASEIPVTFLWWPGGSKDLASASFQNPITQLRYVVLVLSGLIQVPIIARRERWDAMIALWAIPSGLFAWAAYKSTGIPYGVWALGSDIWARKKYPFGHQVVREVLRNAAFRYADGLTLSRDAEDIANLPCEFVPSFRKLPAFRPAPDHLPGNTTNFLYIGRYKSNKGPDVLMDAMSKLLLEGYDAHLHLFGDGSLRPILFSKSSGKEENIHIHGIATPQTLMDYMQHCQWLVIPSRIDSIPLIFGDAIQMEIPVIATEVGDLGKLVNEYQLGFVVPPEDPDALKDSMIKAMQMPKRQFIGKWDAPRVLFDMHKIVSRLSTDLERISLRSA